MSSRTREFYYLCKRNGICVHCMTQDAIPGRVLCGFCSEQDAELHLARERRNRAAGFCRCGKPPTPGYRTCLGCRTRDGQRIAHHRREAA